ncbi:MAG: hypothetical protein IAE77_02025 [Prosthecobacter sp.]|jgi:hypothetical protein|uniref:hypothetical protein n=1 Tax=Prosthecobacter sp. TaxID=1965333 RepID=UPI0019FA13AD|nr:hypothetical protein [Prosthecobacter sp.]MBE2282222.1 hypothetical protein [Prosthecobacter sp.]
MKKHFILYLDILGFSNLIDTPDQALEVLRIVDSLNVHRHEDFEVIFFSDTLLVFNKLEIRSEDDSKHAVMFLCEFAKDLLFRCLGKGYFFRGIITHGDFHRERMKNVDAFFGPATRDAHKAEKELKAVGLFIDNYCLQFSSVFHARRYNERFSFVFLTQAIKELHFHHNSPANNAGSSPKSDEAAGVAFPLDWILVFASGLEDVLTKECSFLHSIGSAMKAQIDEPIRRKYETTWGLYKDQYPTFMKAFVDAGMQPDFISQGDWSPAKALLQEWESQKF